MNIRAYTDSDLKQILQLHEDSNLGYTMPDMNTFYSKRIVEDRGTLGMAVLQKLNTEVYLVCNPKWRSPAWRMEAIKQLHGVCGEDAKAAGAREAISFLPPDIEGKFSKRLLQMGWLLCKPYWNCYYKEVL